jgi:hypothetical protein
MSIKATQAIQDLSESFLTGMVNSEIPELYLAEAGPKIKTEAEIRAEWMLKRRGKFTASEAHRLMTNGKTSGELSEGAKTYCMEKAVELLTEFDPEDGGYISREMRWGMDQEHEAVEAFMAVTGLNVKNHGREQVFIELGPDTGGTPDGVYETMQGIGGVEIKCPNSITHLSYFNIKGGDTLKAIEPKYYWQCTMLMLVKGASYWHFISYDPRFIKPAHRLHIAVIEAYQDDINRLVSKLDMAIKYRDSIINQIRHCN